MSTLSRQPYDLYMVDDNSCLTNIIAMVRWLWGHSDLQGEAAVREVERLTGRQPGTYADTQTHLRLLLERGAQIIDYNPIELERVERDRQAYLRQVWASQWGPGWDAHWTDERVDEYIAECRRMQHYLAHELQPYHAQITAVQAQPTMADVRRLVEEGWLVELNVKNSLEASHAILLYGHDEVGLFAYCPKSEGSTLEYATWSDFTAADVWTRDLLIAMRP